MITETGIIEGEVAAEAMTGTIVISTLTEEEIIDVEAGALVQAQIIVGAVVEAAMMMTDTEGEVDLLKGSSRLKSNAFKIIVLFSSHKVYLMSAEL